MLLSVFRSFQLLPTVLYCIAHLINAVSAQKRNDQQSLQPPVSASHSLRAQNGSLVISNLHCSITYANGTILHVCYRLRPIFYCPSIHLVSYPGLIFGGI